MIHLVNPSHLSFGVGVITPRWLFVLAGATPPAYGRPHIVDETLEPFNVDAVQAGDIVGIGIHTGNALRGYDIGKRANARGATCRVRRHPRDIIPAEAHQLGARTPSFAVTEMSSGPSVLEHATHGALQRTYEGGTRRRRSLRARAVGVAAGGPIYVGFRADRPRLPEALFVLLGLANRRTEASAAGRRHDRGGDHRATAARLSVRGTGRRQLLPGDSWRISRWLNGSVTRRGWNSCAPCGPNDSN
jgi:hypothetical protein